MSGLKRSLPELRFSSTTGLQNNVPSYAVTPDEIDRYEVVTIVNPNTLTALNWFGTWAVAGTAAAAASMVVRNAIADWPRNAEFALAGSSVGLAGTATAIGRDQFGGVVSETFSFGSTDNGGTVVGTKIFAQITSASLNFGTAVGGGTARLGLGTTGTTAQFGLPFKVGAATDLKILSVNAGTGGVTVNGGTIAAFINVANSSLLLPVPQTTGTMAITAWVRPTFNSENLGLVANLLQRV